VCRFNLSFLPQTAPRLDCDKSGEDNRKAMECHIQHRNATRFVHVAAPKGSNSDKTRNPKQESDFLPCLDHSRASQPCVELSWLLCPSVNQNIGIGRVLLGK
jgi:hypothetical protein